MTVSVQRKKNLILWIEKNREIKGEREERASLFNASSCFPSPLSISLSLSLCITIYLSPNTTREWLLQYISPSPFSPKSSAFPLSFLILPRANKTPQYYPPPHSFFSFPFKKNTQLIVGKVKGREGEWEGKGIMGNLRRGRKFFSSSLEKKVW